MRHARLYMENRRSSVFYTFIHHGGPFTLLGCLDVRLFG